MFLHVSLLPRILRIQKKFKIQTGTTSVAQSEKVHLVMKKFASMITLLFISYSPNVSNADQKRIDLTCSWNDGDIENVFVIFDERQVLDTNLVRNAEEWRESFDSFESSCSINDIFISCVENFVTFNGRARGNVNLKLSRTSGSLQRNHSGTLVQKSGIKNFNGSKSAICVVIDQQKKLF